MAADNENDEPEDGQQQQQELQENDNIPNVEDAEQDKESIIETDMTQSQEVNQNVIQEKSTINENQTEEQVSIQTSEKPNKMPKFSAHRLREPINITIDLSVIDRTWDAIKNTSKITLPKTPLFRRKQKTPNDRSETNQPIEVSEDKPDVDTEPNVENVQRESEMKTDQAAPEEVQVEQKIPGLDTSPSNDEELKRNDTDQVLPQDTSIQSTSNKLPSFLPKLNGNKLEPLNLTKPFGIDLASIDRTLDNIKNKTKSSLRRKPKSENSIETVGKSKGKFKRKKMNSQEEIIDQKPDDPLSTSSKIIFAAPQQLGDPFIPIRAYRQDSTGKLTNEINENLAAHCPVTILNQFNFEVIWRNLTYYPPDVKFAKINKRKTKVGPKKKSKLPILNNLSGVFRSGQLTGIMGPSGSGKTVLLNCLAGFLKIYNRKENSGDILVNGLNSIRIGFVQQFDHLIPYLTVRETLLYTSKIRNAARYYLNHDKVVNNVLKRLDLQDIVDLRLSRCSSGQRKRVSIAIELVFNSDILMLDEPTTGVDSVNGSHIVSILKSLTKRRKAIAILATIHQPSSKIFSMFDNIIILSKEGTIIYQGHPGDLPQTLQLVGLSCPMYTGMADFALEVASGDFGRQSLHLLTHYNNEYNRNRFTEDLNEVEMHSLREAVKNAHVHDQRPILLCIWYLLRRSTICNFRNPFNVKIRNVSLIFVAMFLGLMFTDSVGEVSTCFTKYTLWNIKMEDLFDMMEQQTLRSRENIALLFMVLLVSLFNSMMNLAITIPQEIYIFRREYNNYSYTIFTYFVAKTLSEIPFLMISTATFVWAVHRMTGQIFDDWNRVYLSILPCCMTTLIGEFIGIIIGTVFYKSQVQAIYALTFLLIPTMLCSGFFKLIKNMNVFMANLTYISFLRPAMNALMIITYGVGRCSYQSQKEYEEIQQKFNSTGDYQRPEWIDILGSLIDFQISSMNSNNSSLIPKFDAELSNEDKLSLYMGISLEAGEHRRPIILQYLGLGDTIDSYWNQILELGAYCLGFYILVYLTMYICLKRQKN